MYAKTSPTPRHDVPPPSSLTAGQLPKFAWVGVLAASLAIAAGVFAVASSVTLAGTVVVGVLLFLVTITALSWAVEGRRRALDRLAGYTVTSFFLATLVPLVSLAIEVIGRGVKSLNLTFFTTNQLKTFDLNAALGAQHAIVGSLVITGWAILISVPVGLFTAIYLVEYGGRARLAAGIRFFVDVMTGIPSIVAGLFAYTLFSVLFSAGTKNAFSGAIALSVLMIPTVVRSTEEMLRLVPNELREASYALGVPKWLTIIRIVLPTSLAGIITGIVLGVARIIGETAPLLVTAGYFLGTNYNAFSGETATLPVFVYNSLRQQGPRAAEMEALGWTGALVLVLIVMGLNLIGRIIAWKFAPKPGR